MAIDYKTEGKLVLSGKTSDDKVAISFVKGNDHIYLLQDGEKVKLTKHQLEGLGEHLPEILDSIT